MNGSQEGRIHGLNTILNVSFLQTRSRICSHRSKLPPPPPPNINLHYTEAKAFVTPLCLSKGSYTDERHQ